MNNKKTNPAIQKLKKIYQKPNPGGYKNYQKSWTKWIDNREVDGTMVIQRDMYKLYEYWAKMIVKKHKMGFDCTDDDFARDFWSDLQSNKVNIFTEYPGIDISDLMALFTYHEMMMIRQNSSYAGQTFYQYETIPTEHYNYRAIEVVEKTNDTPYKKIANTPCR